MPTEIPPRIAIIARLDHPGGVQSVVLSLIQGLNDHGIRPDVVWDIPPRPDLLLPKGAETGYQPVRFPVPSRLIDRVPITIRYFLTIANTIKSSNISQQYDFYFIFYNGLLVSPDTPHLYYLSGPPLLPQLDMASPGLRGLPYRFLRGIYRKLLRYAFPAYEFHRHSHYVINSEYTAQLFEEAHGVRLPVVHPPIDFNARGFQENDIFQRDTITFFSRFVDYKRPEMMLQLADCFPHQRFILMGGVRPQNRAFYEMLRQKAHDRKNVFFYDNPTDQKVKEELARTRFYIFPAINEHFGMATAEAIVSGAVPFVHDSGGQREIVPLPDLRFNDSQFIDKFTTLQQFSPDQLINIRGQLNEHVSQFSKDVFMKKMLAFANLHQ